MYVGLARSRNSRRNNAVTKSGDILAGGYPTPVYAYRGARPRVPTNVGRELNTVTPNIKRLRHRELCKSRPGFVIHG